jgi:hypothetical protein
MASEAVGLALSMKVFVELQFPALIELSLRALLVYSDMKIS